METSLPFSYSTKTSALMRFRRECILSSTSSASLVSDVTVTTESAFTALSIATKVAVMDSQFVRQTKLDSNATVVVFTTTVTSVLIFYMGMNEPMHQHIIA